RRAWRPRSRRSRASSASPGPPRPGRTRRSSSASGESLDELLLAHRGPPGNVALLRALVELLARQLPQLVVAVAVDVPLGDATRGIEALAQCGHEVRDG